MRIRRIAIGHDDIQELGEIAAENLGKDYVSVTDEMIVIGRESYSWGNRGSAQWDMVVLKKKAGKTEIDIVTSAGRIGLFGFSSGADSNLTPSLLRHLGNYCDARGWSLEEIA